ncbi:MAG: hypothetical protein Q8Q95_02035 [bacterium]|nr:hypothetical protein [bacterium]
MAPVVDASPSSALHHYGAHIFSYSLKTHRKIWLKIWVYLGYLLAIDFYHCDMVSFRHNLFFKNLFLNSLMEGVKVKRMTMPVWEWWVRQYGWSVVISVWISLLVGFNLVRFIKQEG